MSQLVRVDVECISIYEAVRRGIRYVRQPNWANPYDHMKIDILPDGSIGPWLHLYSPINMSVNGRDPVDFLAIDPHVDVNSPGLVEYVGPTVEDPKYQEQVRKTIGEWEKADGG